MLPGAHQPPRQRPRRFRHRHRHRGAATQGRDPAGAVRPHRRYGERRGPHAPRERGHCGTRTDCRGGSALVGGD